MGEGMTIQEQDGRAVLRPDGELTIFEAAEFHDALLALCEKDAKREINFSQVSRIDSSCVQLIVAASHEVPFHVTEVSSALRQQFESIGCEKFLNGPVNGTTLET